MSLPHRPSFFSIPPHLTFAAPLAVVLAVSGSAFAQTPPPPIEKTDPASAPSARDPIDVRVEGDRGPPRASRDPGVASFVVRGDELKRPGATVVELLLASPGVEPSRTGAGSDFATLSIRGAPSAELPVYLAGVRLNDDITGAADLSTIPLFALDRIEVFRGNAPADADRLGIGGAVFLEPKLPRGTHAGALFGAGSFGALTFGGFASLGDDRAGALFSFSRQSATNDYAFLDDRMTKDTIDDRVVKRDNGDATTHDAWALGRAALPGGGRVVLLANAFSREQGISGASYSSVHVARNATQREIGAASVRLPCSGAASARAFAGVGDDTIDNCSVDIASSVILARRDIDDPHREAGFTAARASISGDRWEEKARLNVRIGERLRLGVGAFVGIDRLEVDLLNGIQTRAARLGLTGSANVDWRPLDWLELFALLGGECHSAVGQGQGGALSQSRAVCAQGGPAARMGLRVMGPGGFEVLASGGSYLRVPVLGELYGVSGTVLGNPALVPERGYTGEASARWAGGTHSGSVRAYADVTGFARFVESLIVYKLTRPDTIKPFNIAAARILGVEVGAGMDMLRHVRAQMALTLVDPRNVTAGVSPEGSMLPYHAELTGTWGLEAYADPSETVSFVDRIAIGARFNYRSARYADASRNYYLREQRELSLDASAALLRRRVGVRVSVSNLLDVTNQDLLGFPQPGRAAYGSLEATW